MIAFVVWNKLTQLINLASEKQFSFLWLIVVPFKLLREMLFSLHATLIKTTRRNCAWKALQRRNQIKFCLLAKNDISGNLKRSSFRNFLKSNVFYFLEIFFKSYMCALKPYESRFCLSFFTRVGSCLMASKSVVLHRIHVFAAMTAFFLRCCSINSLDKQFFTKNRAFEMKLTLG